MRSRTELNPGDKELIEDIIAAELGQRFPDKLPEDADVQKVIQRFLRRIAPLPYLALVDIYQVIDTKKFEYDVTLEKVNGRTRA